VFQILHQIIGESSQTQQQEIIYPGQPAMGRHPNGTILLILNTLHKSKSRE